MMTLKDEVSTARSETKEKIMQMQYIEKEKEMLEMQINELKNQIKRHDEEVDGIQAQKKKMENKLE
jgi:predicted  nucleic acid-binding Zn-ribbon protein